MDAAGVDVDSTVSPSVDSGSSVDASDAPEDAAPEASEDGGCRPVTCPPDACGARDDGCGGRLDCGPCDAGCKPKTCTEPLGPYCGKLDDGCGGTLDCGGCVGCDTCGGAGLPHRCGGPLCAPRSCFDWGKDCGLVGDGCGAALDCGTCPSGRACVANVCVVDPDAGVPDGPCVPRTCAEASAECGVAGDGCGGTLDCGTCAAPKVCGGCTRPPNRCTAAS